MPAAIVTGLLAAILIGYGCGALARKVRLRSTATALEGEYIDEGWFRPGHIVGRGFAVRIVPARRSFRTHVELSASSVPGPYLLDAGFFDAWPDWNHAKVPQVKRERAFFFHVTYPGYGPPTDEQRNVLWRWLTRGSSDRRLSNEMLTAAKIRRIVLGDERVSTTFNGIVSNASRLRHTINLLRQLASDDGA